MTKRKMKKWKKILVISVVVLLLIVITPISVFWFYPYPRHIAWNKTPIESSELFDYPDQILFHTDKGTRILRREQDITEAYEAFWKLLGNEVRILPRSAPKTPPLNDKMATKRRVDAQTEICMEFRYRQRRTYTRRFESIKEFEFDAVVVLLPEMATQHCLNGVYKSGPFRDCLLIQGSLEDFENYVYSLF